MAERLLLVAVFSLHNMALHREKKKEILKTLGDILGRASSLVFVNFHGLHAADTVSLRKQLRESGVHYLVAKKTLIKKALEELSLEGELPALEGEIALAYSSDDPLAAPRESWQFAKKHKDSFAIVGGIFEGAYCASDKMTTLASIPSREVLYGQIAYMVQWPISGLVTALDAIAKSKESSL